MPTIHKTLQMFEFIKIRMHTSGYAPTIAEIGKEFGFRSPASVHDHLLKMEAQGWITRSRCWRGIEIVGEGQKLI